jgi:hypothetical protein
MIGHLVSRGEGPEVKAVKGNKAFAAPTSVYTGVVMLPEVGGVTANAGSYLHALTVRVFKGVLKTNPSNSILM